MSGFRFLFPMVPIALILGLAGYEEALASLPRGLGRWSAIVCAIGFAAWAQWVVPVTTAGDDERREAGSTAQTVARFYRLADAFAGLCRPEHELATDVAGVFAYLTECRVLDTWGLASREIAQRGRPVNPTRFQTYGVVAPEVVLERRVRFILPYPHAPSPMPLSRSKATEEIFPTPYFLNQPEMEAYTLKHLTIDSSTYSYFERGDDEGSK
jgi:hypothetical protein